jgi:hypothetical protein
MTPENVLPLAKMNRRRFLALSALGALPCMLSACGMPGSDNTPQTLSPIGTTPTSNASRTPTLSPSPTRPPSPTEADWKTLAKNLQGTLVRPDSSQYATASQLFHPRFDSIRPAAIAYCASPGDVQACLSFVRQFALPFTARSGGHSYAGYSTTTGLVIDVTRMNTVTVNTGNGTATIGAGALLIDIYGTLAQYGLVLPAASCATVGIAGVTLGGGISVLGRKFGLTCDNLLSAQVVVADGRVLTCDASHNADLFWALRGGGGGNFGVVTSFTFQTHAVSALALLTLDWPWSNAAGVIGAWQNWAPQAPDALWSNCLLLATSDKSSAPIIRVNGVYVGDVAPLNTLVQQLINKVGVAPSNSYVSGATILNIMLDEAGCYGKTVDECHLPTQNPQGQLQRDSYKARSDYYKNALSRQAIDALINAIAHNQASATIGKGMILLDACGGAINRVRADATAFVHRDQLFSAQYIANWHSGDPASVIRANDSWLADTWQSMRPYASGSAYQNYIDPDLPDWQNAYYGANLSRLQRIKAMYDPGNLFHFNQSIPLMPQPN